MIISNKVTHMRYFWTKISDDMQMAAELKTMNKTRRMEMDVLQYEEREGRDGKITRNQVSMKRAPVTTDAMPRLDVHRLAMSR